MSSYPFVLLWITTVFRLGELFFNAAKIWGQKLNGNSMDKLKLLEAGVYNMVIGTYYSQLAAIGTIGILLRSPIAAGVVYAMAHIMPKVADSLVPPDARYISQIQCKFKQWPCLNAEINACADNDGKMELIAAAGVLERIREQRDNQSVHMTVKDFKALLHLEELKKFLVELEKGDDGSLKARKVALKKFGISGKYWRDVRLNAWGAYPAQEIFVTDFDEEFKLSDINHPAGYFMFE